MSKESSVFGLPLPASLIGYGADSTTSARDDVLCLFDECAAGLRRYIASFGLSAEVTKDVLQEAFLQLFRHLRLGRSRANLRGWIQTSPDEKWTLEQFVAHRADQQMIWLSSGVEADSRGMNSPQRL
jgi:hypothetical protein